MSAARWLMVGAVLVALVAIAALMAHRVSRDPEVRALIGRLKSLGPRRLWRLARAIAGDRRVPWFARLTPIVVVLYLLLPFDLIPDFLPVIGQLDDLLVLILGVWLMVRLVPPAVFEEHWRAVTSDRDRDGDDTRASR